MNPSTFLQLADTLPEGYVLLNKSGTIIELNKKAVSFFCSPRHKVLGTNLSQYTSSPKNKLDQALTCWSRSRTPMPAALVWNANHGDVETGWRCHGFLLAPSTDITDACIILRCSFGRTIVSNFLAINNELHRQQSLLRKLQRSRDQLAKEHKKTLTTLHSIGDAVITTDSNGLIEYLNPVAEALTEWSCKQAIGKPVLEVFNIINEMSRKPVPDPVAISLNENRIVGLANHTILISRSGREYVIEDSVAPIRDQNNKIFGAVLVFHDTTDDRLTRHQLEHLAQHDTLTGLKNRHYFEQQLKYSVDLASRGTRSFYLLYIDLDQFKVINDTSGHAAGDNLLGEISCRFGQLVRQGDILARLGGDEFGILVVSDERDDLDTIVNRFLGSMREFEYSWNNNAYDITCSIGITTIDQYTSTAAEAMRQADIACYISKQEGRNRFHAYQSDDQSKVSSMGEFNIVSDIRKALVKDNFELHLQPIVSLEGNEVMHEILIRMKNGKGLLQPNTFIPVAERHGLMVDIDIWVLNKSLNLLKQWSKEGNVGLLSVNLSGPSLTNELISNLLKDYFQEHPDLADKLILEITETSAVGQLDAASKLMHELRSLGIRFALDDFGAGFSSFTYLKHLPVDYVKIDGAFVKDIVNNPVDQAMVRSITQISNSLKKMTIAESVEDEFILNELREIGVDFVQGYHTGRPQVVAFKV